jgi:outer membrane protein OmpA-like peptidoglycan-associated protein
MNRLLGIVLLVALAGCSTTTAILLPDENGKVGALVLKNGKTEQVVDKPYTAAQASSIGSSVVVMNVPKEQVERRFGSLLKAQPVPAASFTLYFMEGSTELTEESMAQLNEVVDAYKAHKPAKVYIIGHTDRAGDAGLNMRLAMDRAKVVEQQLRAVSADFDTIEVRSFGENDPLVPTPDGVAEPRNRRVEILIL